MQKVFDTRNFLKHRRVHLRCLSVTWDKKFLTRYRDKSSFPPSVLSRKFFGTRSFLKQVNFPHEPFWYCETKQFRRNIVIIPLLSRNFFDSRKFLGHRRVLLRNSLALWSKKKLRKKIVRGDGSEKGGRLFLKRGNFFRNFFVTVRQKRSERKA